MRWKTISPNHSFSFYTCLLFFPQSLSIQHSAMEVFSGATTSTSTTTTLTWVLTLIVALVSILGFKILNSMWLRPKRFERILRARGLQGDPYKFSSLDNSKQIYALMKQHEANSQPFTLSNDVAPRIFSPVHSTVAKYGKNSFFWQGTTPKVIITDPEQIKAVFNNMQDFPKPNLTSIAKFFTVGLVQYEGDKWAKHRRIINPVFHLEKLKDMLPAFLHSCQDMINQWKGMLSSDGTCEIDVWPFIQNLTCDVISRTAFGSSYAEGTKIFQLLRKQGYLLMTAMSTRKPLWGLLPTTNDRKANEIERDIRDLLEGMIRKRGEEMKNGETSNKDLLGALLESNHTEKEGNRKSRNVGMTNQEVIEECKLFYLAGQETTSSLLIWTMVLLGRYPEWQERARQEVLQVFGSQILNTDGLSRLKIVTMILYEVLRLYPPIVFFHRALQKDVKLGNLALPAGVLVTLPILLTHHDHDLWGDDAKEFKPERFSEGIATATRGQVSFFPFGWGPRICIGQNFALLEAKIVLSLLLQNFSFELSPAYAHAPTAVLSLQPKHGAPMILRTL